MPIQRIALASAVALGLAVCPLSSADAQYYGPPCTAFPLTWPFCIAGAAVGTAAAIATAPFRGPYYYPYYYAPTYYYPRRYWHHRRHRYWHH